MVYKVGDRVRIVSSRAGQLRWNISGRMDKYMGTVMTITKVETSSDGYVKYRMKEDDEYWHWYQWMIECKEEKVMFGKSDLANGDILIMRNGQRFIMMKNYGGMEKDTMLAINTSGWCNPTSFEEDLTCKHNVDYDVMKVLRPTENYANMIGDHDDEDYSTVFDRNAERKKMTVEDIERELGYKIAVVDKEGADRG